jgi:hypothetical protein
VVRLAVVATTFSVGLAASASDPTSLVVRNVGAPATRVQIALGDTLPCDSPDNRLVFDGALGGGEARVLSVPEPCVCARNTTGGSPIDFGPSRRFCGGARCTPRGRSRACLPDASVPIRVDVSG